MADMKLNSNYWNNRWLENQTGWDIGHAAPALTDYGDQLADKSVRILIPGCGNAYEAEHLHRNGFSNVFPMDYSEEALNQFAARVPDFPKENLVCGDFFSHNGSYDLILEQTFFCAIDPNLRSQYVDHVHNLLCDGGKLVGLLWDDPMFSDHPPYGGNVAEYRELFAPKFTIKLIEPATNSIAPRAGKEVFFIAQKS